MSQHDPLVDVDGDDDAFDAQLRRAVRDDVGASSVSGSPALRAVWRVIVLRLVVGVAVLAVVVGFGVAGLIVSNAAERQPRHLIVTVVGPDEASVTVDGVLSTVGGPHHSFDVGRGVHSFVVHAAGYAPATGTIDIGDPGTVHRDIQLRELPNPPPPTTTTTTEPEPPLSWPVKRLAEIQLGTSPYAETTIDGRKYGSTPFFGPRKLALPIGSHKVEFFDKQNNKKYRYQIDINGADPANKVVIRFTSTDPPRVEGEVALQKLD